MSFEVLLYTAKAPEPGENKKTSREASKNIRQDMTWLRSLLLKELSRHLLNNNDSSRNSDHKRSLKFNFNDVFDCQFFLLKSLKTFFRTFLRLNTLFIVDKSKS